MKCRICGKEFSNADESPLIVMDENEEYYLCEKCQDELESRQKKEIPPMPERVKNVINKYFPIR